MTDGVQAAIVWIHGAPARSWEQVAQYLSGDAHDRSKVQVLIGERFFDLRIQEHADVLLELEHLRGDWKGGGGPGDD